MSLLSKVLRDRRSQAGLGQVWSRMFRWDAKPDNIQVSLSQGWGVPQYSCASYLDSSNQQLYQYSVMVPAVPNTLIPGEASQDRQLAMMNCACAALQGIARETERRFSSENCPASLTSLSSLQGPHLQSAQANSTTVLTSQEVARRRTGNKARKGGAARKKLQARPHPH